MNKQFPHPFGAISAKYRAYRKRLPGIISTLAVTEFKGNFRAQGLRVSDGRTQPWAKRQDGSRKGGAILIKSGRLRRGMRASPSYDHARVINATPYSAIHNQGGQMRGHARYYGGTKRSRLKRWRPNPGGRKAHMPARPFMRTTPRLHGLVSARIRTDLEPIFNAKP